MAGTITVTMSGSDSERINGLLCANIAWETSADGACSGTVSRVEGTIEKVVFYSNPASGEGKPEDNYDITLKDQDGVDVLGGAGADIDPDAAVTVLMTGDTPVLPIATAGLLTLEVLNAGGVSGMHTNGIVRVFFRR